MHFRPRAAAGFTLIELLVVPRYFNKVEESKEAVLRDNLRVTRDVLDKFYGDNGRYPEALDELVEKRYLRGLPVDPITESTATWQIVPVPEGYKGSVYDIRSGATGTARDGKNYADW